MRNIIFTSMAVTLLTGAAGAQEGPETGCYARSYDAAHMAAHPDQVVEALRMRIFDQTHDGYTNRFATLYVDFANQGHVRRDGHGAQLLDQYLICYTDSEGRPGCAVECDGGSFYAIRQDDKGMTIETRYLMVGDNEGCGGAIDMAEIVDTPVKYRLNRVQAAVCSDM